MSSESRKSPDLGSISTGKRRGARPVARLYAWVLGGFFLCQLAALVVAVPYYTNRAMTSLRVESLANQAQAGMQTLDSWLDSRIRVLSSFARLPLISSGVMSPQASMGVMADFFQNVELVGDVSCFALYDLEGNVILLSRDSCGAVAAGAADGIVSGRDESVLEIAEDQNGGSLWVLGVPIFYNGLTQGALLAFLPVDLAPLSDGLDESSTELRLFFNNEEKARQGNAGDDVHTAVAVGDNPGLELHLRQDREVITAYTRPLMVGMGTFVTGVTLFGLLFLYRAGRRLFVVPHNELVELADKLEDANLNLARKALEHEQTLVLLEAKSEALEQQESLIRSVVEDQTELIYRFRTDGTLTFANEAFCRFFGLDPDEAVGRPFDFPEYENFRGDPGQCQINLMASDQEDESASCGFVVQDAQGRKRWVEWTYRKVDERDELQGISGKGRELQGVGRDQTRSRLLEVQLMKAKMELKERVRERTEALSRQTEQLSQEVSERRMIEEQLREYQELLQTIYHAIRAAIFVFDPRSGNIVASNDVAQELLGLSAEEIMESSCRNEPLYLFTAEGRRLDILCPSWEDRDVFVEGVLRFPDRRNVPISRQIFEIMFEGELHLVQVVFDITERKSLERQLAISQKLESIGQLAAGVAHEINTPIQYIGDSVRFIREAFDDLIGLLRNYAELRQACKTSGLMPDKVGEIEALAEDIDVDFLMDEMPRACDRALDGADRVAVIVRAMKQFSHPGSEEKQNVDINRAIESTITVTRNEWKYVADVELNLDEGLPLIPAIEADINQVVLNILINAAHAISEKMENSEDRGNVTVTTELDRGNAVIRIRDTGGGIPDDVRDRIFDPFFTTKEVGRGTGQGLAIVHDAIVNRHSGSVEVNSTPGEGTEFVIRLPIHPDQ